MTPPILQDTRLAERFWRSLMRWMAVGDEQAAQVNLQRKIAQTNLAALLAAFASAAISVAFWLNGNPALVTAAWLNLPFPFLYLLVLHLNRRSHSVLACWTLFALLMADVMIGVVFAHGVTLAAHHYFIAFAVMAPMLFAASHWRSAALVLALNFALFLMLDLSAVAPLPDLAQIDQSSLALIRKGIVGTCVILLALLIGIGEYSAAISDSRLQLQASSDTLTRLPNRLALRQAFVLELARRQREFLAAQRMCCVIETTPFQYNDQSRTITISIGLAHMTPADTEQSALRRADAALYQAKHQGRNRVIADQA
jgi:GGDEF domain-containing protein